MTILTQNIEKSDYLLQMNAQLDEWSKRINFIKSQVDKRSIQVKNDYHENMSLWKAKREILLAKLDEILKHTGSNFESLRFGAQKARFDVLSAYKKFSDIN